jgi:intein-encoded DNA endonuclease-like protein
MVGHMMVEERVKTVYDFVFSEKRLKELGYSSIEEYLKKYHNDLWKAYKSKDGVIAYYTPKPPIYQEVIETNYETAKIIKD